MALKRDIDARMIIGRGEESPMRVRIGDMPSAAIHLLATRLFDRHGLHSVLATRSLISYIERFDPDIIHLHNIHGYYLHYPTLMQWLRGAGKPVVWTLHDCWPFTGHCAFPVSANCTRYMEGCYDCPLRRQYPSTWFVDRSRANYRQKRQAFSGLTGVMVVPVGEWIADTLRGSFMSYLPHSIVRNGINLDDFRPIGTKSATPLVLGVASKWDDRKGLNDFIRLREKLPEQWRIRLIGLTPRQIRNLPQGIEGVGRINDPEELARNYSAATVFVNPTKGEGDPITKMEALACGTPVVTYDAGGAKEGIEEGAGIVVPHGNFDRLVEAVMNCHCDPAFCRGIAEKSFDMRTNLEGYFKLYAELSGIKI